MNGRTEIGFGDTSSNPYADNGLSENGRKGIRESDFSGMFAGSNFYA